MSVYVVRFDAELLVHQAEVEVGCGAGVVVNEPTPWGPPGQTQRVVHRCTRPTGHDGEHSSQRDLRQRRRGGTTTCGIYLDDGAWIDWTPSSTDPRCPHCHGVSVHVPAVEAMLL